MRPLTEQEFEELLHRGPWNGYITNEHGRRVFVPGTGGTGHAIDRAMVITDEQADRLMKRFGVTFIDDLAELAYRASEIASLKRDVDPSHVIETLTNDVAKVRAMALGV